MGNNKIVIYTKFILYLLVQWKLRLLEKYNIFKNHGINGTFLFGSNHIQNTIIGKYSYVAYNSIIQNTTIGRYCSIGPNVVIGFGDHKIDALSTHPSIYLYRDKVEREKKTFERVYIGNDVWIGANVYIKNGIKIGNGAIIGAGSVVTKDVENYAIVFGVPAKLYKMRFDELTIEKLLNSKWWEKDLDSIINNLTELEKELISPGDNK